MPANSKHSGRRYQLEHGEPTTKSDPARLREPADSICSARSDRLLDFKHVRRCLPWRMLDWRRLGEFLRAARPQIRRVTVARDGSTMDTYSPPPAPALSIIVVSWNTKELLRDCLSSVLGQEDAPPLEIIVVDNASSDGSADMVADEFPGIRLIRNAENVGFARANNLAIPQTQGDYILLLNSDTLLHERSLLREWVDLMNRHPAIGASGCRLLWPDGSHQVGDAGFRPSLRSILGHFLFLSRISFSGFPPLFVSGRTNKPLIDVDWVTGAACLVRRSILEKTGFLDPDIFMYAEDVEWCCRMRERGFRVAYLPPLEMVHIQRASAEKQSSPSFSHVWLANTRALYARYNPKQPRFVYDMIVAVGLGVRAIGYSMMLLGPKRPRARVRLAEMLSYLRFTVAGFGRSGSELR